MPQENNAAQNLDLTGNQDTNNQDTNNQDTNNQNSNNQNAGNTSQNQNQDTNNAGSSDSAATASDASKNAPHVVPAADQYSIPQGFPKEIGQLAHNAGLSQEQLDKLLPEYQQYNTKASERTINTLKEEGANFIKTTWGDSAKTNLTLARTALKKFDVDGKLSALLKSTGYGSHPAVLSFFYDLGKGMTESGFIKAPVQPGKKMSLAEKLYPSMTPKEE